jgi:hypothetical protein
LFPAVRGWRMRDVQKGVQLLDMEAMAYVGVEERFQPLLSITQSPFS